MTLLCETFFVQQNSQLELWVVVLSTASRDPSTTHLASEHTSFRMMYCCCDLFLIYVLSTKKKGRGKPTSLQVWWYVSRLLASFDSHCVRLRMTDSCTGLLLLDLLNFRGIGKWYFHNLDSRFVDYFCKFWFEIVGVWDAVSFGSKWVG